MQEMTCIHSLATLLGAPVDSKSTHIYNLSVLRDTSVFIMGGGLFIAIQEDVLKF